VADADWRAEEPQVPRGPPVRIQEAKAPLGQPFFHIILFLQQHGSQTLATCGVPKAFAKRLSYPHINFLVAF